MSTFDLSLRELSEALDAYRSGRTLSGSMYLDEKYFPYEMKHVLGDNYWMARLSSELPNPGDFAVLNIGSSSIIIARGRDKVVRGFYNSCRHRGATLCREEKGTTARIICPYHAWSYGLDGALLAAPFMGADFNRTDYSLFPVHVREERGFIFVNLCADTPPDFDAFMLPHREYLDFYGFDHAKVALRKRYVIEANWKLAIENLMECYHCGPSHPSLCLVEGRDELIAYGIDPASPWAAAAIKKIRPRMGEFEEHTRVTRAPAQSVVGWNDRTGVFATQRYPLAKSFDTGTLDGRQAAPFMGSAESCVGTGVRIMFSTTAFLQLYSDHAVSLSYLPTTSGRTIVDQAWIVDSSAELDTQALNRLTGLWDATSKEDGWLSENQVEGIRQPVYRPGPLSAMEGGPKAFLDWYIARMRQSLTATQ